MANPYIHSAEELARKGNPKSNLLGKALLATGITALGIAAIINLFSMGSDIRRNNQEADRIQNDYNRGYISTNYVQVNSAIERAKKLCAKTTINPRDMNLIGNISVGQYQKAEKIAKQKPIDTNSYSY